MVKEAFSVIDGAWLDSERGREAMAACNRADKGFIPLCKESPARKKLRLKWLRESTKPPDSSELDNYPVVKQI